MLLKTSTNMNAAGLYRPLTIFVSIIKTGRVAKRKYLLAALVYRWGIKP